MSKEFDIARNTESGCKTVIPLTPVPAVTSVGLCSTYTTAPFNNMRTLKFEAQPTNGFFAAVNQVFGGSS